MFAQILFRYIKRELIIRYSGSILGSLWIVIYPLAFTFITTTVFSLIFNNKIEGINYVLFVLSGNILWVYFSQGIISATRSLVINREIVANAKFDWSTLVIGSVLVRLTDFTISFIFLIFFTLYLNQPIFWSSFLVILIIFFQTLVIIGFGLILAILNVFYRDIQNIVEILMQILYFMTPIIYPLSIIPREIIWILKINPLTNILLIFRQILFGLQIDYATIFLVTFESVILFLLGIWVFRKNQYKLPELI